MADLFSVSASGMEEKRIRMNIIASNLANVETTRTATGGAYRRKDIVFETHGQVDFGTHLKAASAAYNNGVKVSGVIEDARPLKYKFEPGHPDADKTGYVAYPNVNAAEEMVNMIAATRSHETMIAIEKANLSFNLMVQVRNKLVQAYEEIMRTQV